MGSISPTQQVEGTSPARAGTRDKEWSRQGLGWGREVYHLSFFRRHFGPPELEVASFHV